MSSVVALMGVGIVDPHQPILTAHDLGLTRGDGCFDATRLVLSESGELTIDHLETHLDRFEASAAGLDMTIDRQAWVRLIDQAVDAWQAPGESTLKLLLTRGIESRREPTGVVTIDLFPDLAQRRGIRVAALSRGWPSDAFKDARWLLGGIKTTSYAVNMAAKREAARRGADDALFVTTDGYMLEGPNAALVWAVEGRLFTTPHEHTGVLRSITQGVVFDGARQEGVPTAFRLAAVEEVLDADGAWLLSSIRGVAPIVGVDDTDVTPDPDWTRRINQWGGFPTPD